MLPAERAFQAEHTKILQREKVAKIDREIRTQHGSKQTQTMLDWNRVSEVLGRLNPFRQRGEEVAEPVR